MSKKYNKLIRDRIPQIIEANNQVAKIETMSESDFISALLKKLREESDEVIEAKGDKKELEKEISDVYEVIDSIIDFYNLDKSSILETQKNRRKKRGGFKKKLFLVEVKDKN